jgi:DNA-binding CsgD family transcriptional regulator
VADSGRRPARQAADLFGRADELEALRSFLDRSAERGDALLITGTVGVGKTALVDAAAEHAAAAGTRVLRADCCEVATSVGYAGLGQILRPLLPELDRLDAVHRCALHAALALNPSPAPGRVVVSTAALILLRQLAATRPILVVVDDLPWLDRPSADVLGFLARRTGGARLGFLATSRVDESSIFDRVSLPEYYLEPLDVEAAVALLNSRHPTLAPSVRDRVISEAQGNPLALTELPTALHPDQRGAVRPLPDSLPLGPRLEALFAARIGPLPAACRHILLLGALEGNGDLRVLQAAAGPDCLDQLVPAERPQLVRIDMSAGRLRFRHPVARSAVVALATDEERRRAHRELADALDDHPERQARHRAAAADGPDESVAQLLVDAAYRSLARGDATGAVADLTRAGELSPDGSDRSTRFTAAAFVGADVTGQLRNVSNLLIHARQADPGSAGSLGAATAAAYQLLNREGDVDTAHRLLVGAVESWHDRGDGDQQTLHEALHTLLLVCWFGRRPELWEPLTRELARLEPGAAPTLQMSGLTLSDPARLAHGALGPLSEAIAALADETDPTSIERVARAAIYVDRVTECREPLWRVVRSGRAGQAVTSALNALNLLSVDSFMTGEWPAADELSQECKALCLSHGYRLLAWPALYTQALLAAARGDETAVREATAEMVEWAAPRGAAAVRMYAAHARTVAALATGNYEEAFVQASSISPAGVLASHVPTALWVAMELVEAAVRCGRAEEARAHVAALQSAGAARLSPRLALLTGASEAMTVPADRAGPLFESVLAIPGVERWPFDLGRVELAYGELLRRERDTDGADRHLAAAHDTFRRLGATPWTVRAARALRATGQASGATAEERPLTVLTPQEHQIAQLAAAGLTNKQIGERLFLSHRTVGASLYRIFPKLGVTARAGLRDALALHEQPAPPADTHR